jgi:N-acetylglucosaminyl-diphospho-decaprenol L-rhamnosyltransferase
MTAAIGVVVVAYRSVGTLGDMLDSLTASTSRAMQVIVVDNSPADDGTAAIVESRGAQLLPSRDNPGYGTAVNRGVDALDPDVEWLVVANPDLRVEPGAIDELLSAESHAERVGSLGPLIRDDAGVAYPSARKLPSLRTGIGHALFVRVWPENPWTRRYRNDQEVRERTAGWLSGAFLVVRRRAFAQIGGFDQRYFMYFEDVDLGRRLGIAGWNNLYVPSAVVVHTGAASTRLDARPMIRAHHRSAYLYLAEKYHAWYLWPLRVALRLGLWVRGQLAHG